MLYLKSYCYSKHELPFIIANLNEGFTHIDKLILYEYNFTHTGLPKKYEIEKVLHLIPEKLKSKLLYKKIDLTNYVEYAVNDENKCHQINENIQRSWLFNDKDIILHDEDIIIDIDIDEIIYNDSYNSLLLELNQINQPLGIKLNQFFFKNTYLWSNLVFDAPSIYKYAMIKHINKNVKGILINIFGGIMRCDVLAQGVVDAAKEINLSVPLVVRLAGTNFKEGKEILDKSNLKILSASDLNDAAKKIVEAIK